MRTILPFLEQDRLAVPARDADIGLLRLPGPLTTQPITATVTGLWTARRRSSTSAAMRIKSILVRPQVGARNQHGLPCSQPERAEQVEPSLHLPDRISRQGDPDGIPDTVEEQGTDPGGGFEQPHPLGARLGHAEMERIGAGRRRQAVSGRHGRHMGRFE